MFTLTYYFFFFLFFFFFFACRAYHAQSIQSGLFVFVIMQYYRSSMFVSFHCSATDGGRGSAADQHPVSSSEQQVTESITGNKSPGTNQAVGGAHAAASPPSLRSSGYGNGAGTPLVPLLSSPTMVQVGNVTFELAELSGSTNQN